MTITVTHHLGGTPVFAGSGYRHFDRAFFNPGVTAVDLNVVGTPSATLLRLKNGFDDFRETLVRGSFVANPFTGAPIGGVVTGFDFLAGGDLAVEMRGLSVDLADFLTALEARAAGVRVPLDALLGRDDYLIDGADVPRGGVVFEGYGGDDTLLGGAGRDFFFASGGSDLLSGGGDAFDIAIYEDATAGVIVNNTAAAIAGAAAFTVAKTGAGVDALSGIESFRASQFDDVIASAAQALVFDRAGDDVVTLTEGGGSFGGFAAGSGDDRYVNLGGFARVDYGAGAVGVGRGRIDDGGDAAGDAFRGVDLVFTGGGNGTGRDPWGDRDTLVGVDEIVGTRFADRIVGDDRLNVLNGFNGDDTLDGGAGDDFLFGGFGDHVLRGGEGDDTLMGGPGSDVHDGGAGVDLVRFSNGGGAIVASLASGLATDGEGAVDTLIDVENLQGSGLADRLTGDGADNLLMGDDGDDTLIGGAGADTLDGGAGIDLAAYFGGAVGVTVDLVAGRGSRGEAAGDRYVGIEGASGTAHADVLLGDDGPNLLQGNGGNDFLRAGAGSDTLLGGGGDDVLAAGEGADSLDGGSGVDEVRYDRSAGPVAVDLSFGTAGGDASGDVLVGIENVTGSAHDDILRAGPVGGVLRGLAGDDALVGVQGVNHLIGGAGADRLIAGTGDDRMNGGAGADAFVFFAGRGFNRVNDFQRTLDRIEISNGAPGADGFADVTVTRLSWGTRIDYADTTIALIDVTGAITAANFDFV